jgi:hypothetical protein
VATALAVVAVSFVLPTFAGHDTANAGVIFRNQNGSVVVCGRGRDDQQETSLRITSSTLERPDARICVARDYLLQALAAGFRTFHFVNDESPLYSRDQSGGIHVLMPLRLGEDHPAPTAETAAPAPEPATATPPVPVEPAAADSAKPRPAKTEPKKEKKIMPKPEKDTAFDKLLAACEAAKAKLKDANDAVTEILSAAKDVGREDKQRRTEIEQVRAGLAKLQTIKV